MLGAVSISFLREGIEGGGEEAFAIFPLLEVEVLCGGENLFAYDHPIEVEAISKFSGHALDLLDSECEGEEIFGKFLDFGRICNVEAGCGFIFFRVLGGSVDGCKVEDFFNESKAS